MAINWDDFEPVGSAGNTAGGVNWSDFEPVGARTPAEDPGIVGTILGGAKKLGRNIAATADLAQGDTTEARGLAQANADQATNSSLRAIMSDIAERKARLGPDAGWMETGAELLGAVAKNPAGAGYLMAEQLPNAAAVLGGAAAGSKLGAMGGAAVGSIIPGAGTAAGGAVGGILGGIAGMFGANFAIEGGAKTLEHVGSGGELDSENRSRLIGEGASKAAVITGVDVATFGASKWLLGTAARATESATTRTLLDAGIDGAAVKAATQAPTREAATEILARAGVTPEIAASVRQANDAALLAVNSIGKKVGRGAAVTGLETFGEGAGEYLGEYAATGKLDKMEALIESFSSLGQSGGEIAIASAMNRAKTDNGMARISAAATADDAIAAFNDATQIPPPAADPLALPNIAGAPLVVFPDGSTMTRAEAQQRYSAEELARLDAMVQQADSSAPLPLGTGIPQPARGRGAAGFNIAVGEEFERQLIAAEESSRQGTGATPEGDLPLIGQEREEVAPQALALPDRPVSKAVIDLAETIAQMPPEAQAQAIGRLSPTLRAQVQSIQSAAQRSVALELPSRLQAGNGQAAIENARAIEAASPFPPKAEKVDNRALEKLYPPREIPSLEQRAEQAASARAADNTRQSAEVRAQQLADEEGQGEPAPVVRNFRAASDGTLKLWAKMKDKAAAEGAKAEMTRRANEKTARAAESARIVEQDALAEQEGPAQGLSLGSLQKLAAMARTPEAKASIEARIANLQGKADGRNADQKADAQVAAPSTEAAGGQLAGGGNVLVPQSSGDTGRAGGGAEVDGSGVRPAGIAGELGGEGVNDQTAQRAASEVQQAATPVPSDEGSVAGNASAVQAGASGGGNVARRVATAIDLSDTLAGKAESAKQLAAGAFTQVSIKGGTSVRLVNLQDDRGNGVVTAYDDSGKPIGRLSYNTVEDYRGGPIEPSVNVDESARRKGVATAMYDLAESTGGKIPAFDSKNASRSDDGQAFRAARAGQKQPEVAPGQSAQQTKDQTDGQETGADADEGQNADAGQAQEGLLSGAGAVPAAPKYKPIGEGRGALPAWAPVPDDWRAKWRTLEVEPGKWRIAGAANANPFSPSFKTEAAAEVWADREWEARQEARPDAATEVPAAPARVADKPDDASANAVLDAAQVTGRDRLEAIEKFRAGTYSLEDLRAAYPAKAENKPAGDTRFSRDTEQPTGDSYDPKDDGGRDGFWRRLASGDGFTSAQFVNALEGDMRTPGRGQVLGGGPQRGDSAVGWRRPISGFKGYVTYAITDKSGGFTMFVIPHELVPQDGDITKEDAYDRAIVRYTIFRNDRGTLDVGISDPDPGSIALKELQARGAVSPTGQYTPDGKHEYQRVNLGTAESKKLLREVIRRYAMANGDIEAISIAQRDTGANLTRQREFSAQQIKRRMSRSRGAGISLRDAKATIARVSAGFKNLPKIHVLSRPSKAALEALDATDLFEEIRGAGALNDVEGAFFNGEIFIFTDHIANEERLEHVLFEHELTHYGLRGVFGEALDQRLNELWLRNKDLRERAREIRKALGLTSNVEAIEEALAELPAAELAKLKGWHKFALAVRDWLASHGFTRLADKLTSLMESAVGEQTAADLEAANMVRLAMDFARNGSPNSRLYRGTRFSENGDRIPGMDDRDSVASEQAPTPAGDESRGAQVTLFHGSAERVSEVKNRGAYGGLFANADEDSALSHGGVLHRIELNEADIMRQSDMEAVSDGSLLNAAHWVSPDSVDRLRELVVDDAKARDADAELMRVDDAAEASIEAQRLRGVIAKSMGYKAVEMDDEHGTSYLVLPGAKITNETTAPAGSGATRFSRAAGTSKWDGPEPSKMDDFIYSLQDKQIDMKRVVQAIKDQAGAITDKINPYLQEELFHGRAAKGVKDFLDLELRPLMQEMRMRGVEMSDFEEYLWNRHAEERNNQIASLENGMKDGGSGIKTADARAYLSGLSQQKRAGYESLAKRVDAINKSTRQMLVSSGLEKAGTVAAWEGAYQYYVPLQREDVDTGGNGTGQGFSIKGSASKRAVGSNKPVADILANIAMQREKTIVRAEKNRMSNALLGLAAANPNPDFWKVDEAPKERVVVERAGKDEVVERVIPGFISRDNVVSTRINGEDHYVVFNERDERALRMAQAIKNLDADQLGRVLSATSRVTRYFAAVNTQWNPIFGVINLTRDVQGALLNLSTTPIAGEQKKVLGYTVDALRGIYSDIRAKRKGQASNSAWAQLWEEFQNEGGQTGYRDQYANSEARADALEKELRRVGEGKAKAFGRAVFDWLSDYNETMENSVRLAAYRAGKESGMSSQQAASMAKSLTVNFNKKGQVATQVGALYAFFNASAQGTARLAETLTGPMGKKIIGGGILLGAMQAMLLAAAGMGDDEPPEFVRERSLILPIGDGKYLSLPMPLGFHAIVNLGRIPTEFAMSGFKNPTKRIADLLGVFADTFNPIGNAGISLQTISPTVVDPFAALAENRDWTGKPIAREDMNQMNPTPGHSRHKDTATTWSKAIAYGINALSGGSKYRQGMLSPTPDQIDYLIGQVTGGVGREVSKIEQTAVSAVTGEELPMHKIPLLGRFVGDTKGQAAEGGKFYESIKRINGHEAELKGLRKDGKGAEAAEYLRDNREAMLVPAANAVERDVQKLRKAKREAVEAGNQSRVKLIEMQITARMAAFNKRVRTLQDRP